MCWTRRWPLARGGPAAAPAKCAAAAARARTSAGSFTMSSATSSMARAASISSRAAAWRCSTTSWAFSSRCSCDCVPSSVTGCVLLGDEGDLQPIAHHLGRGNGAPLERVGQHDSPPIGADADEQFVLYASKVQVVMVGERQLERKDEVVAPALDAEGIALMEHGGGVPIAVEQITERA